MSSPSVGFGSGAVHPGAEGRWVRVLRWRCMWRPCWPCQRWWRFCVGCSAISGSLTVSGGGVRGPCGSNTPSLLERLSGTDVQPAGPSGWTWWCCKRTRGKFLGGPPKARVFWKLLGGSQHRMTLSSSAQPRPCFTRGGPPRPDAARHSKILSVKVSCCGFPPIFTNTPIEVFESGTGCPTSGSGACPIVLARCRAAPRLLARIGRHPDLPGTVGPRVALQTRCVAAQLRPASCARAPPPGLPPGAPSSCLDVEVPGVGAVDDQCEPARRQALRRHH